ncbi:MAG: HU-CCDC81 and SPOR domain-containing protein [Flavobacteriales bacterium]|nr:HU-CCDC81 and SPOR domain-containing protein [Flavobacteriales bacterium]NCG28987.1 hypothetical protein [Bacteroidota bacterium]MBT3963711.1 HU-CCDC81 and SPOR domain-containing protein [Flavobacteriales bacterium]MBT4706011.1 HU-CCDC81 and SPOR domain-containing protein [Flavobacteriales bacterium]MBT4931467.1 HU-CCDC81 and SPOR domain-containing protein [Flavobacteriales bacterium]
MRLDDYIASLLEEHDCVIVPDFGGFVANYSPAKINPVNNRFDPPFRKITFNQFLVHNDGLLAAYVAQREQQQYEQALQFVKDYVVLIKNELRDDHKTKLEDVGILYRQADGSLRFEQLKNEAHFKSSYGLESFFSNKIERKPAKVAIVEPKAKVEPIKIDESKVITLDPEPEEIEPAIVHEPVESQNKRRVWPAVAASLSLPLVGYLVYVALGTPLLKDRSQFHYSDLNPFAEKNCPEYKLRADSFSSTPFQEIDDSVSEAEFMEMNLDTSPDKTLVVRLSDPIEKMETLEELRYHIIGGCFGIESNATRLTSKYKSVGSNANIVDQKGSLYRVSVASFASRSEAVAALGNYQREIPGAWLLYK